MSHTRTQRHTKLAQYVIQPKNTVRSRHFAPRMRVSKGIKDSKASFARRAQNGQPRSSFSRSPLSSSLSILLLLAILSLLSPPSPRLSASRSCPLSLYLHIPLLCSSPAGGHRTRSQDEAIRSGRVACTRAHTPKELKSVQIVVQ